MADQANSPPPAVPTTPTNTPENPNSRPDRIWGRKAVICLLGIVTVAVLAIVKGDMTSKEAVDQIIYLVLIGVGGIALEDGIGKIFKK
jgi:hypothetical protein